MPDGAAIFETSGAWEDFSTPSRDLRLLIAIDVVLGFPDRVARRPERYAMPKEVQPICTAVLNRTRKAHVDDARALRSRPGPPARPCCAPSRRGASARNVTQRFNASSCAIDCQSHLKARSP